MDDKISSEVEREEKERKRKEEIQREEMLYANRQ